MKTFAYFDTSAWLKLYINEEGTDVVREMAGRYTIVSSSILLTESYSAIKRRQTARQISKPVFLKLIKQIRADVEDIDIIPLLDLHIRRAETIVLETHSATLDALHIASALVFSETTGEIISFFTADKRQAESAEQLGLKVIWIGLIGSR
jgi:predicted nucleic acid-binding protein